VTFLPLACALAFAPITPGQPPEKSAPDVKRAVIEVRHAPARDLAAALSQHFQGAPGFRAVPAPARTVEVEVWLADSAGEGPDAQELSGPAEGVLARLRELRQQGKLTGLRRVRLTATEGQRATAQFTEERPMLTGSSLGPRGQSLRNLDRRNVGTLVEATPRIAGDAVALGLRVEDSRVVPAEAPKSDEPPAPDGLALTSVQSSLTVPAGRAVLAAGLAEDGKPRRPPALIVVTARVVEPSR
jgi:Bacterial type II and III secretion system protein